MTSLGGRLFACLLLATQASCASRIPIECRVSESAFYELPRLPRWASTPQVGVDYYAVGIYYQEWEDSGFIAETYQGLKALDFQKIGAYCVRVKVSCQSCLDSPKPVGVSRRSEIDLAEVEAVVEFQLPTKQCPQGTVAIKRLLSVRFIDER